MKPSVLGLVIATVAFGASTIYLSVQLQEERVQAEKFADATRALNARIAELEKTRDQRFAMGGSFGQESFGAMPAPPPSSAGKNDAKPETVEITPATLAASGPPRNEAFQKMMRSQIRSNNKRIYADLGAKLGLSKEDTAHLIDMLTDQQVQGFTRPRDFSQDPAEHRRLADEANRENQAELENFLGASKTAALREYQDTIPARQELDALTRQMDGADATLSEDQQERLLTALIDERKRIPTPKMSDAATPEEYTKAYSEWQSDYNDRVNSQARSILNTEQMSAYSEYQQWQKEMRDQMAARRAQRGPHGPGGPTGNVTFSAAAPIGEAFILSTTEAVERPRDQK